MGRRTTTDAGTSSDATGRPGAETVREYRGTGVFWVLVALFVPVVLIIVLLAQNSGPVLFQFLWLEAEPPLFVVLLVAVALGAAVTESAAAAWRHQRRRMRNEHEELQRLRSGRS